MKTILRWFASLLLVLFVQSLVAKAQTTWYVRPDGGTRYDASDNTNGQCDGKHDAAYPGSGINQPCAVGDYRYLYDDGAYGDWSKQQWAISGGDTVIIRGGPWRVGFDTDGMHGNDAQCLGGNGPFACTNPTIPSGSPSQPTRILGENYGSCSSGNSTIQSNLTQIFGGHGVGAALNLSGAQNVQVSCLEITDHTDCVLHGMPAYPSPCYSGSPTLSDYDSDGIATSASTSNVLLQDLWIHGHPANALHGPIGANITLSRVNASFNGFAGWNFDDGYDNPNGPNASIAASYVTMEGNGCNEEYPIVHSQFPATSCYDLNSGGFGDSWSGQDATLASFTCDHCQMFYNTKDGFIGPHTQITNLTITNSMSYGNMGQQWKWGSTPNSTTTFVNNLTVGNCQRMSQQLPGAPMNYSTATGAPGGHLSMFCRAAGDIFSFYSAANSSVLMAFNTTVGYSGTMFDLNCRDTNGCGSTPYVFRDNIMVGYLQPNYNPANPQTPGLYYYSDGSDAVTEDHNIYYNMRNGGCSGAGDICADPLLINEPPLTVQSESQFDNFNFNLASNSPAIGAGISVSGIVGDFNGNSRPSSPSIGAMEGQPGAPVGGSSSTPPPVQTPPPTQAPPPTQTPPPSNPPPSTSPAQGQSTPPAQSSSGNPLSGPSISVPSSPFWLAVANENPSVSVTLPAGATYRFGDYVNNVWSDPITLTTATTFSPVFMPAGVFPFSDPDPGVAKELDVLMYVPPLGPSSSTSQLQPSSANVLASQNITLTSVPVWITLTNESNSVSVTLPPGATYRLGDYADSAWSTPTTTTTTTTFNPVFVPAGVFPFSDPDPGVAKELDVLLYLAP
jgi:hypothetical protein